jgi:hypothetical protein
MRLVTGQPPGFTPTRFPKMGRTGNFWPGERSRKRLGDRFYQEIAAANTENGNRPPDGVSLLGHIAACLV